MIGARQDEPEVRSLSADRARTPRTAGRGSCAARHSPGRGGRARAGLRPPARRPQVVDAVVDGPHPPGGRRRAVRSAAPADVLADRDHEPAPPRSSSRRRDAGTRAGPPREELGELLVLEIVHGRHRRRRVDAREHHPRAGSGSRRASPHRERVAGAGRERGAGKSGNPPDSGCRPQSERCGRRRSDGSPSPASRASREGRGRGNRASPHPRERADQLARIGERAPCRPSRLRSAARFRSRRALLGERVREQLPESSRRVLARDVLPAVSPRICASRSGSSSSVRTDVAQLLR